MNAPSAQPELAALALSILRSDFLRGGSAGAAYQEWFHFWISTSGLDFLLNFSVTQAPSHAPGASIARARVVVLVREGAGWDGDAENIEHDTVELREGRVFARMGEHSFDFEDGVFRVRGKSRRRAIDFDLRLVPCSFPSAAHNASLGPDLPSINWLAVPYLKAHGVVVVAGRTHTLSDAPAYHDHNWGSFSQRDLSWQWGHVTAATGQQPISAVFARLLNRAQTQVHVQSLLLWHGARQLRVLRDEEIQVRAMGQSGQRPFTVPRAAALLLGDFTACVPARFEFDARGHGDEVFGTFCPDAIARIVVPNTHDLGTTIIHETVGRFELRGHVRGEPIALSATGVFEFLGGVA